jgi:hypothetical protein
MHSIKTLAASVIPLIYEHTFLNAPFILSYTISFLLLRLTELISFLKKMLSRPLYFSDRQKSYYNHLRHEKIITDRKEMSKNERGGRQNGSFED